MRSKYISLLFLVQGLYYFLTGLWALLDIFSFMKVTGPKTDIWLVKTIGGILMVIGIILLLGIFERKQIAVYLYVAAGIAIVLGLSDFYYSLLRMISPVYFFDGCIEATFVLFYLVLVILANKKADL